MEKKLEEILAGRFDKERWMTILKQEPSQFARALRVALTDEQPQAWRATWLLGHCTQPNDRRLQAHLDAMIQAAQTEKDGHQREWLKILEKMELGEDHEGALFDVCMTIWENVGKSPSVRITAFRILINIAKKYPELENEIAFLTQDHYAENLTPGVRRVFEKMISKKKKI